jgi:2-dehydro-3-deoxyglucarate aldolase/4-hydroxy-2-oxoheptanedioate aldolase
MSNIKQRLKNGESIVGTMITVFDNPDIVKILKVCGFDLFMVDCEHGCFDHSKVAALLGMARAVGIAGFVRVPQATREVILRYMEAGAHGIMLPNCDTVEQAKLLVEYAKYAPLGNRGVSLLRAHSSYVPGSSPTDYMQKANDETVIMCQIESATGVANAGAMLDLDGIDAAFIGPNDLSQSYGLMGQFSHPTIVGAIESVAAAAKERGKFSGIHIIGGTESLRPWMDKGMTLNLWSNDIIMMMNSAREGLAQLRAST